MEASQGFLEILLNQSPLVVLMGFGIYVIWGKYVKVQEQKDNLADKVITNNIYIQEQMKDMIENQKKTLEILEHLKNGKLN
jgi:hypothetical protein